MKKKVTKLFAYFMSALITVSAVQMPIETLASVDGTELIINQVYGGGGKGETPISNSFIEIYNPTNTAVNLEDYSVTNGIAAYEFAASDVIPANGSWLIAANAETTSDDLISYDLPEADGTWDVVISNKTYSFDLKRNESIVDTVATSSTLSISKQKSLVRINHVDTDTDADFQVITWKKEDVTVDATYINNYAPANSKGEKGGAHRQTSGPVYTSVSASDKKVSGYDNRENNLNMELYARYNSNALNADGGSMEIVQYNEKNGYSYTVSGLKGLIIATEIKSVVNGDKVKELSGIEYDVKPLVEAVGAAYGDITGVAISPDGTKIAAAIQHSDYNAAGYVAVFECKEDGTLVNPLLYNAGVQPDMVIFANDNTILSADEGEPRNGYAIGTEDPKGTVSIIDLAKNTSEQIGFSDFTSAQLKEKNVIIGVVDGKEVQPVTDLEPEYIAVSKDGKKAYVTLQEANAIAVLDIKTKSFSNIFSCGYEDYSKIAVDLVEDEQYKADTYENLVGARMPDALSIYEVNEKTYILTANEGDAREWGDYKNEAKTKDFTGENIRVLDSTCVAGIPQGKTVMFGGRGFTIYEVTNDGIIEIYDSKNEFEVKTAEKNPKYFNCSNDDNEIDSRSGKKGPEAESITVGSVNEKTYAFIALERIGGVMAYDITDPSKAAYANYINSREFADAIQGDVSPEGLCFIKNNASGNAVLLAACEVSGTLAAYELTRPVKKPSQDTEHKNNENEANKIYPVTLDAGSKFVRKGLKYKVSKKDKTVTLVKVIKSAKKKVVIPKYVVAGGVKYRVTAIAAKAFYNNKKIQKVIINADINKIGKSAFAKSVKIKSIIIKSTRIKSIGKNAFKLSGKKIVIKVPKRKLKAYKKLLKKSGISKKSKIIK